MNVFRLLLCLAIGVFFASKLASQQVYQQPSWQPPVFHQQVYQQPGWQPPVVRQHVYRQPSFANHPNSTQARANRMAGTGVNRHFGGSFTPGATREGWGFSTRSAQDAIQRACYYGQRQIVSQSVSRGTRGWHAVIHYR